MLKKIGRNDLLVRQREEVRKTANLALDEKINSYKLKGWKIPTEENYQKTGSDRWNS